MFITFSIIQTNSRTDDFEKNFLQVKTYLNELSISDKHIVILPELWTGGFSENPEGSNSINYEIISSLKEIAENRNLVIAGSYIIKEKTHFYNQMLVINKNGIVAKYNKNHLFPQLNESSFLQHGEKLSILKIWGIQIGMAICYDLRFPEIFRDYASQGVDVCLLPAQWPEKRISHFTTLVTARAIENQMVMATSNVCGKIGNTQMGGNSMVVDHLGVIQSKMDQDEGFATTSINLEDQKSWRDSFPVLTEAKLIPRNELVFFKVD